MNIVNQLRGKFKEVFNAEGAVFASPGRVNLIGEHTDYNEGFVLPGAIDKYMFAEIAFNNSDKFQVYSFDYQIQDTFDKSQVTTKHFWAKYILGVVKEIELLGCKVPGFNAVFGGNIPIGSGLSSSAALESVFAFGINEMLGLGLTKLQLAKVGQMAEHHYAGVKCGIMDQFASLHGEDGKLMRLDCRSFAYDLIPFNLTNHSVVLIDTQVKHQLASSEYNVRRQQCEQGVEVISKYYPEVKSLRDVNLEQLLEFTSQLEPVVIQRCSYVINENIRLNRACQALFANDIDTFGEMMFGSHLGLKNDYEVSCQELDYLVDIAAKYKGVIGARMMGGGFGGCTINVLESDILDDFIASVRLGYSKKFMKEPIIHDVVISKGSHQVM